MHNSRPRRETRRLKSALVGLALLAAMLTACSSGGDSDSDTDTDTTGDQAAVNADATVRVGIDFVATNWDPIQNTGNQGNYTLPEVYDQLVQFDADLQPAPMLATSWEYNTDGTSLTMTLRDDAVFNGSGAPVNAEAVKATIERARTNPKSLVAGALANVASVDATDDTTVTISFVQPSYTFIADLAGDPRISSIVDPSRMDDSLAQEPQGSGPYTVAEATQSKVVFTRVESHWDDTSGLAKTLEFQAIPDENARFNGIKSGQLDVSFINSGQFDAAKQLADTGQFQAVYATRAQKYLLRVNGTPGHPLADATVREAISKAIDRNQFCDTIFGEMGTPSRQPFVETNPGYDADLDDEADMSAQPDEARSLLAEAGATDLTMNILALAGSTTNAEVLQQQLADVGVTVKIETQASFPALVQGWLTGDYDSGIIGEDATWDPGSIVRENITNQPLSGGVPDYLTEALDAANTATPGDARDQAFGEVNTILTEQPVSIPLCNVGLGLLGSEKVVGLDDVRGTAFGPPFEIRRLGMTS